MEQQEKKSLGEKVTDTFRKVFEPLTDLLISPVEKAIAWGVERLLDDIEPELLENLKPTLQEIIDNPETPANVRTICQKVIGTHGYPWSPLIIGLLGGIMLSTVMSAFTPFFRKLSFQTEGIARSARMDPRDAVPARWRDAISQATLEAQLKDLGWPDDIIAAWPEALQPLLSPDVIRQLHIREEDIKVDLRGELAAQGWSLERIRALEKLYEVIPPLADMTTMAMRLAFSPESRQYWPWAYEAPADFVAAAKKIGLSPEWCQYYWFIHWTQPSISLQYEMLHRGEITKLDVERTLWALGYSDWWIPHIIKVSYRPFTRVDVRRMYGVGVLDRPAVKRAYLDLGYDDAKAESMTEFTIKYQTSADRDLTKADVLSLYRKAVLSYEEAKEMLVDIGYSEDDAAILLAREDTQQAERVRELSESKIKSMALAGIIDQTQTTTMLADLGYTAEDIQRLYALWAIEAEPNIRQPSRTDLENFYEEGIIDADRWIEEMYKLGYTEEYISWYYLLMTSAE